MRVLYLETHFTVPTVLDWTYLSSASQIKKYSKSTTQWKSSIFFVRVYRYSNFALVQPRAMVPNINSSTVIQQPQAWLELAMALLRQAIRTNVEHNPKAIWRHMHCVVSTLFSLFVICMAVHSATFLTPALTTRNTYLFSLDVGIYWHG